MSKRDTVFKEAYNLSLGMLEVGAVLPSEAELARRLGVSRTTVRAILDAQAEAGLIAWNQRHKEVLRPPTPEDHFPAGETDTVSTMVERAFMRRILSVNAEPGSQINESDFAREVGVSTSAVREFLIRFSRFGLIEKQRNRHWVLNGFTEAFALELFEVREMFELRSARTFVRLPPDNPAWAALDAIEAEHRSFLGQPRDRLREFPELDDRFHRLIHGASHNRFIIEFYDVISLVFHYHYQWSKTDEIERNSTALREHLDYIGGLRSGHELDAEFYCRKHLSSARDTLLRAIKGPFALPPDGT